MNKTRYLCKCGCGEFAKAGNKYIYMHHIIGKPSLFYGRKHKPESIQKMSVSKKGKYEGENNPNYGKKHTPQARQKMSIVNKGKVPSEETRKIWSEQRKGEKNSNYGKTMPEEQKLKISKANKGKKRTAKMKRNMREARADFRGEKHPMYGRKHTPESIQKMSDALSFENNPAWLGGISFEPYSPEFNDNFKQQIRERDDYTCQLCGKHENELTGYHKKHAVHHIDYDKKNSQPSNTITLCIVNGCHVKTNTNREYWEDYFKKLMDKEKVA